MAKATQITFTTFADLKTDYFSAVESMEGKTTNQRGTRLRPGQLMEAMIAQFIRADERKRIEMVGDAIDGLDDWLRTRRPKLRKPKAARARMGPWPEVPDLQAKAGPDRDPATGRTKPKTRTKRA